MPFAKNVFLSEILNHADFISGSNPQVCVSSEKVILHPIFGQICSAELAAASDKDNAYLLVSV